MPPLTEYIHRILNPSDPLKFAYTASSYKPFISLFNVTGVAQMNNSLAGVGKYRPHHPYYHRMRFRSTNRSLPLVDFSGSIAFEVRTSPKTGPFIRFNFKNGTTDSSYNTYGIMGSSSGDVPVQTFIDKLSPFGVETLPEWCTLCGNINSRGCQFLQEENMNLGSHGLRWGGSMSPMGAGLLGAGLAVVVVGIFATVGVVLGLLRVGKRKSLGKTPSSASSSWYAHPAF